MRGVPKKIATYKDILNLARGLPVLQAAAFVGSLQEDTWEQLQVASEDREAVTGIIEARLMAEDRDTQRRKVRIAHIQEAITLRTKVDEYARDARRLKEIADDFSQQIEDHRAERFDEALLSDLVKERDQTQALFASVLAKHQAWMQQISRLRKKMKDAEEV